MLIQSIRMRPKLKPDGPMELSQRRRSFHRGEALKHRARQILSPRETLTVAAGNDLLIVHGRDRKLSLNEQTRAKVAPAVVEVRSFPFAIRSVAVGDFNGRRQTDIALLLDSGSVHLLTSSEDMAARDRK